GGLLPALRRPGGVLSTSIRSAGVMPAAAGSRARTPPTTSPGDRSRWRSRFAETVRPTRRLVRCGRRLVLHDDPIAHTADGHDLRATRGRHLRTQPRKVWLEPE